MLYHGSLLGGLEIILANAKSHSSGGQAAYFTEDRVYALACCRKRSENFVTMGPDKAGRQHYFERFPGQLQVLYRGREGFLYCPVSSEGLVHTRGNTWESPDDVPVTPAERVPDLYLAILEEEQAGNVVIHRYDEIDPAEQKEHANYIRDHLYDPIFSDYRAFLQEHFSPLWDKEEA